MPEGDTIHKLARRLGGALTGRKIASLWLRDRGPVPGLAGARVAEVAARGKHLLIALDSRGGEAPSHVLHSHLGMHGRLHPIASGAAWPRSPSAASWRLAVEDVEWVLFRAARAQLLPAARLALQPDLRRLGPDLLAARFDVEEIVRRARRREPCAVAELLLDQRVACGLGNVYKSEILFLEGVHPRTSTPSLGDDRLADLYGRGRELLRRNLGAWPRTTRLPPGPPGPPPPRLLRSERTWVYRRTGRPCFRCQAPIRSRRLGDEARTTFWCPRCQPRPTACSTERSTEKPDFSVDPRRGS